MMKKKSWLRTIVTWSIIALLIIFIIIAKFLRSSNHPMAISKNFIYLQPISSYYRKSHPDLQHDWNDHRLMKADEMRKGPGEHGEKVDIEMLPETIEKVFKEHGHNTMVSMKIALDRAIPDFRNLQCKKAQYRKYLPKVSVIIPFFDEHVTTILRTVTTVLKRTPPKLLKEIILVNDGSTKGSLHQDLMDYIKHMRWHQKVTILDMDVRAGVIWSRLAGARYASGDVLLFLDCHTEVGYNYLPPLIDPISYNYRAVVTPTLDIIDRNTFEIHELGDGRTIFDWNLHPQRVPLTKNEQESSKPYKTPIMYGAAFAMSAKFFWELKPDAGMIIYGGDQFEMSFKVNLCGGVLLESPCSRVAYIYRRFAYDKHNFDIDYKAR
jgi:polypeptide N-acetylgalactosaminyltransferase